MNPLKRSLAKQGFPKENSLSALNGAQLKGNLILAPDPPTLGEIRLLNLRDGIKCEVEWTPPKTPNGRITKYYVMVFFWIFSVMFVC